MIKRPTPIVGNVGCDRPLTRGTPRPTDPATRFYCVFVGARIRYRVIAGILVLEAGHADRPAATP